MTAAAINKFAPKNLSTVKNLTNRATLIVRSIAPNTMQRTSPDLVGIATHKIPNTIVSVAMMMLSHLTFLTNH